MEKMLCGAPNQGGRNCPGAMGGSPVPCATAGKAGLFPQKREKEKAWEASPRPFLRFEEEEPRFHAVCITSMSPSLSRGDGRKSHTR